MLYDPKWEVEVKADPFSLESLIAWLEKQPADREYNWASIDECMCAQYFGCGADWAERHDQFEFATGIRPDAIALGRPWTFGAALERARKALR